MKTLEQKKNLIPSTFFKTDLLKDWQKAGPDAWVTLCDHEHTESYSCMCNSGCECCKFTDRCLDCDALLNKSNRKLKSAVLIRL